MVLSLTYPIRLLHCKLWRLNKLTKVNYLVNKHVRRKLRQVTRELTLVSEEDGCH